MDAEDAGVLRDLRQGFWGSGPPSTHRLTRFFFVRGLGLIYFVAFFSMAMQLMPLLGSDGLLPASWFLDDWWNAHDSGAAAVWSRPTLFWFVGASDAVMIVLCWVGVAASCFAIAGRADAPLMAGLWLLYMSFVHVGQVFWGYGWEMLLLEAGFLAIFLVPPWRKRALDLDSPAPLAVVVLLRWLAFRIMFGAGLIKLRGDPCWTELTCLYWHYETQPVPNPLSPALHAMPDWFHQLGVAFNHFVELVVPFGVFGPRRVRHVAGVLLVAFQASLILSGNLSFLNWLTIVACIPCFDDSLLVRLWPKRFRERLRLGDPDPALGRPRTIVVAALVVIVCVLSLNPVVNMLSRRQLMNASFDPFHLVNTYGAFGSVNQVRYEVVLEGTHAETVDDRTDWLAWELPCKPGDPDRAPCIITPYHYRLDWQMWFAALRDYEAEPWIIHLAWKLLHGGEPVKSLFVNDPFPDANRPPRFVRAVLYSYRYAGEGDDPDAWWVREYEDEYLRPLSRDDPELRAFLDAYGWLRGTRRSGR